MTTTTKTRSKHAQIGIIPEYPIRNMGTGAEVFSGFAFKSQDLDDQDGIPVVKIANIHDREVTLDNCQFFPEKLVDEKLDRFFLQDRDVLIAMTGQGSIGRVGQIRLDGKKALLNQRVGKFIVDGKNLDRDYLYFVISSPRYERILFDAGSGSGQPNLSPNQILSVEIPMPKIELQRKISSILGSLNDKTHLNRQMNKTLEGIGQAIFKHWFIDFEFPNEEGRPYKSSGGEMIGSESGDIPSGWRVGKLAEYVNVTKGCSYTSDELKESEVALVTLKSINRGGGFNQDGYKEYVGEYNEDRVLKDGEIVVAQTDLTQKAEVIGRPAIVNSLGEYSKLVASLDLQIVRQEEVFRDYVYYLLKTEAFHNHALSYMNGTTVLHLNKNAIPEFVSIIPSKETLGKFKKIIDSILTQIVTNETEIVTLSFLRDLLLPKLMSGNVRVSVEAR